MEKKNVVETFFSYLGKLHEGDESVVEKVVELWDDEGVWEFLGAYPSEGKFKGKVALQVLFKNLAHSATMPVFLEKGKITNIESRKFEIRDMHVVGEMVVANWDQVVTTKDGRGIAISGSTKFHFKGDKISKLDVIALPKSEAELRKLMPALSMKELTITDIGRLALAAWAVV